MLTVTNSNIFDSSAPCLVNPVNCEGVSGAGLAKVFKETFPTNFRDYKAACHRRDLRPGYIYPVCVTNPATKIILNAATKGSWRDKSTLGVVMSCMVEIASFMRRLGLTSVAMTYLGCGLGGLDYADVKHIAEDVFNKLNPKLDATIHQHRGWMPDNQGVLR